MTDLFSNGLTVLDSGLWLAAFVAGLGAGFLHFHTLAAVTRRMVRGDLSAVALQLGRLAALGIFLWLLARLGAPYLLAGAAGVLVARSRVLARARANP